MLPRYFFGSFLLIPVILIVLFALWIAFSSVFENIRFARATDQILGIVVTARDFAVHGKDFAMQPGEDILLELDRAGQMTHNEQNGYNNPWGGTIRGVVTTPSVLRIETALPVRDCRRLALFLAKNAFDLGLQMMAAHEADSVIWRQFYDKNSEVQPSNIAVLAACGATPEVTLAVEFQLRQP